MINLVIDVRMIRMSGIGTYIQNILPGLIKSGKFNITCLGYPDLADFNWANKVRIIPMKSKILSFNEQIELFKMIPSCDIYWVPNWNIPILPIAANKQLVTVHDVYHLAFSNNFSFYKIWLVKLLMLKVGRLSRVITVSNFSKDEICKYTNIRSKKISVIPLAPKILSQKTDGDFSIGGDYILYVGNVKPHKNLKLALEALNEITNTKVEFIIVGKRDGFITNDTLLEDLIVKLGNRVKFTGVIDDAILSNYYKGARLFLFPSLYEGFGLPILEAMQFNIPIIASNAASIPEIAGDHVHYFDPSNKQSLIEKLDLFFEGKTTDLTKGYKKHLEFFSWDKTIKEHIEVLINL